jgi:hypothetical protein
MITSSERHLSRFIAATAPSKALVPSGSGGPLKPTCVAQLNERKRRGRLAIECGHVACKHFTIGAICERGEHAVKRPD